MVNLGSVGLQETKAPLAQPEQLVKLVVVENKDFVENLDFKVNLEPLDPQVFVVTQARLVKMDSLA